MSKTIKEYVAEAHAALEAATKIADLTGESFDFDLQYGMGGTYYPKRMTKAEALAILKSGRDLSSEERAGITKILEDGDRNYYESGWVSSSSQC